MLTTPASAASPDVLTLAPLVVLAPRCGLRPSAWGIRLDVALNDAINATSSGDGDTLVLAKIELITAERWTAAPKAECKKLKSDHTLHARLGIADQLIHGR